MNSNNIVGLTEEEVISSRKKFGSNQSSKKSKNQIWLTLIEIVSEPMFIILVCASLIYFVLGEINEGMIMVLAILFVSGISFFQENRSRNAVNSLKKLSSPHAKVLRSGSQQTILTEELVVGDIIYFEDGNLISSDAKILLSNDFSVNESMLTGESLAVFKSNAEAENQIFKGSTVVSGACTAEVTAVGTDTKLGQIGASLEQIKETKTPLQMQISKFTTSMVGVGVVAFLVVWGMNYYEEGDILKSLLKGLTLAMSVLPEEIPVAFSTFMALGAYHLYKKNVIAKSPYTVETLGAATVICTDKTGTLTQNRMQLVEVYDYEADSIQDLKTTTIRDSEVVSYAMWASEIDPFDSMEKSIHTLYGATTTNDQRKNFRMVHEYPLSGKPPIMTHVFENTAGKQIIAVKGSVEGVLRQSGLSEDKKNDLLSKAAAMSEKGYRVLGVGRVDESIATLPTSQHDIIFGFVGLIAFYDPPKENVEQTIEQFHDAGIQVKMITGDHAKTAAAIAKQVGIKSPENVMSGVEIMAMDTSDLQQKVQSINVFARMFPEAKLKVIEALKFNGEVVAMTGDGVNDGPALKAAHIGIAMGLGGSEVAKEASALILMDDDLAWMVDAVALGRKIYENLKKAIRYIISIHIPIILIVAMPLLLFWKITDIFSPIHVIFLELVMGPTCSIIFENEPIEKNSMTVPPRKLTTNFFSYKELMLSIVQGLVITLACLGLGYYYMSIGSNDTMVRTVIYTTLICSNVFLTLVNRSFYYSIFTTIQYKNRMIPLIIVASLAVLFLSIYYTPIQAIFMFQSLDLYTLLYCVVAAFIGVMWAEVYKYFTRRKHPVE